MNNKEITLLSTVLDDMNLHELHNFIDNVIRARSVALHIATSDVQHDDKKAARLDVVNFDEALVMALVRLPNKTPIHKVYLGLFPSSGQATHILQWVKGDNALYVRVADFDPGAYVYSPTSPVERVQAERTRSAEVLEAIKALELVEANPIEADDETETGARLILNLLKH